MIDERFKYFGFTSGLSGRITLPFDEIIPRQGALNLSAAGGFTSTRVENFNFHNIVVFDRMLAFAAGSFSPKDRTFDTTVSVEIEGLNILNIITADRIVARLASSRPEAGGEPSINPIGSTFENLRLAGHRVEVDLGVDIFSRPEFDSYSAFRAACDDHHIENQLTPHLLDETAPPPGEDISCTLVREIHGLGREIEHHRNQFIISGFGSFRLATLTIAQKSRRLSMLDFDLGSTPAGSGDAGGACGSGEAT